MKQFGPFICNLCHNEFYAIARSKYDASKTKYCSSECKSKSASIRLSKPRKNKVNITCKNCNATFEAFPSRAERIFCSRKCQKEYEKSKLITITCNGCGENFQVMRARKYRKYCSQECYLNNIGMENNPRWNGGKEYYYGQDWHDQAKKARERDNFTCQYCGIHQSDYFRQLDVHHVIPFKTFGLEHHKKANVLQNLITLCSSCHIKLENGKINLGNILGIK